MTSVPAIVFAHGVEEYIIAKTFQSVLQRPYSHCQLTIIDRKPRHRSVQICRGWND